MTEEIIIDGVDVAGCEHYTTMEDCDGIHDLCEQLDDYCSTKKNCYYKQLKRLEQENKTLKNSLKDFQYSDEQHLLKVIELEQENKELKGKYSHVLELAKTNADSNEYCLQELEKENKELKKQIESQKGLITVGSKQQYDMTMAYDKCKTALEEIREIAENAKEGRYATKSEDYTEGMHTIGCYVLTRINEVLNENTAN